MRSLRLVLLAVLVAPGVGCKWLEDIKKNAGSRPTGAIPKVEPDRLVSLLNLRADRLHSIEYANISMRVSGKGLLLPANLHGHLAAEQPHNFRLTTTHGLASAKLDMGSNDKEFWIYSNANAKEPVCLYASQADFASGKTRMPEGIPFEPNWVLEALGMAHYPEKGDYTVSIDERERTYTLSWTAQLPSGAVRKEIVFDAFDATGTRPQVRKLVIRNLKTKSVIATAEIQSAQTVQVGIVTIKGENHAATFQYPTRVVLKWSEPRFEMDLTLNKAETNAPLTADPSRQTLFLRPPYKDATAIDLAGNYEFK